MINYHIRKITPSVRKPSRQLKRPDSKSSHYNKSTNSTNNSSHYKQISSLSPTKSPTKNQLTSKMSLQTLIFSKSTYVEKLNLSSTSWCVYDGKIGKYVGFRERTQREIASITKVMTTIIAIEFFQFYQIPKDTLIKVTESSAKLNGTSAELKANTWVYLWDLLYGCMLPSGNDAANLLSQYIGYFFKNPEISPKEDPCIDLTQQNTNILTVEFIKEMNAKAQNLGLSYTTFSNPHGLQNAMNRSTAKDILILSQYVSKNKKFREVMNTDTHRYYYYELDQKFEQSSENNVGSSQTAPVQSTGGNILTSQEINFLVRPSKKYKKLRKRWWNTNTLLSKGWEGIKTGQTVAAGSCLASLKQDIYIVVLNCRDNGARFSETQKIYEWYTTSYKKSNESTQSEEDME